MLILTFEDHEENMIDWIVSCLGIGVKSFQIQNTKTEKLKFRDLRIDFSCRKVIKNNRQECTTAAAVVRVFRRKISGSSYIIFKNSRISIYTDS